MLRLTCCHASLVASGYCLHSAAKKLSRIDQPRVIGYPKRRLRHQPDSILAYTVGKVTSTSCGCCDPGDRTARRPCHRRKRWFIHLLARHELAGHACFASAVTCAGRMSMHARAQRSDHRPLLNDGRTEAATPIAAARALSLALPHVPRPPRRPPRPGKHRWWRRAARPCSRSGRSARPGRPCSDR